MVRGRLETEEEALLIADEAPQHSGDEPLKHHRIRERKILRRQLMLTNLWISLLSQGFLYQKQGTSTAMGKPETLCMMCVM